MRRAYLLHPDRNPDIERDLSPNDRNLLQDLELDAMLRVMSGGDRRIRSVCRNVLLEGLDDPGIILYRQAILRDALQNPEAVRHLYRLAAEALETARRHPLSFLALTSPASVLSSSLDLLGTLLDVLERMSCIARESGPRFRSRGFRDFLSIFKRELDPGSLRTLREHLHRLEEDAGWMVSIGLGPGNVATGHTLRRPVRSRRHRWWHRIREAARRILRRRPTVIRLRADPRDPGSNRTLEDIRHRAIGPVTNTLAQSAERILATLRALRRELAFYAGCVNLAEHLAGISRPIAFPRVGEPGGRRHSFSGLYDVCLALTVDDDIVGNRVDADGRDLVVITGANQGGKTTFLRSVGVAQLMMQCGMFVPAESYCADPCTGIFTHYRREEDVTMERGKLDEELMRMNDIVEDARPGALVLFNESFAATNEREGSEIARQVVSGLIDSGVRVFFVTHLYEFARHVKATDDGHALFLRAERRSDGTRTFRMIEGSPQATSHGMDLYERIFDDET